MNTTREYTCNNLPILSPLEYEVKVIFNLHNKYRKLHEVPPLKYDEKLSKIAQKYAKKLIESGQFQHSNNKYKSRQLGENLAKWKGKKLTFDVAKVVNGWYDEVNKYDFETGSYKRGAGHFTQLVWKNTRRIGIGYVKVGNTAIVVCNYYPPGNVDGEFLKNVSPK